MSSASLLSERDGIRANSDPISPGNGGTVCPDFKGPLKEAVVYSLEKEHIEQLCRERRERHPNDAVDGASPIGLALSGGGTRAAAFHCGLFWALADADYLQDVWHVAAISGGGYTACSYVTHLYHLAEQAKKHTSLKEWYRWANARFLLRMQHNICYIIDTSREKMFRMARQDLPQEAGAGWLPRVFDLPFMILALVGGMVTSPVLLILHTVWPIVIAVELSHGSMLRSVWCDPLQQAQHSVLRKWFWMHQAFVAICAMTAIVLAIIGRFGPFQKSDSLYLYRRSLQQVFERAAVILAIYTMIILSVVYLQSSEWGDATLKAPEHRPGEHSWVRSMCLNYISRAGDGHRCSDMWGQMAMWYEPGGPAPYVNSTYLDPAWAAVNAEVPSEAEPGKPLHWEHTLLPPITILPAIIGFSGIALTIVGALVWGSVLLKIVFTGFGPIAFFYLVIEVARWSIYGPITGQELAPFGFPKYTPRNAYCALWCCVAGAVITLPVYDVLQKICHHYYRRALRQAFFHGGKDISYGKLANSPYCPNLILGCMLSDYRQPKESLNFCDFSIASFFLGSSRTGYFGMPSQARLSHMMTVAGAATDASFLLNADVFSIRFFLAVLALRFGDFLRLEPDQSVAVRAGRRLRQSIVRHNLDETIDKLIPDRNWAVRWLQGLLDRMPTALLFLVCQLLMAAGILAEDYVSPDRCSISKTFYNLAFGLFATLMVLSFFAFVRPLSFLMRSPMVQQYLMLFMHRYKALTPPPYLYVSDGGLLEVLGILPLLRRRLRRIVVSDAAEDPHLSMRCLRDGMEFARKEGLCSFFDPRDPRRDMEYILMEFAQGNSGFLRVGVRYEGPGEVELGEIFYVRMRLPRGDEEPVRGPLTEEELLGPAPSQLTPQPAAGYTMHRSQLGGTCCPGSAASECCGLCAGRRFPDYGMSNQFLTPLHFANLTQLGAELCVPLIKAMRESSAV